jgi:glycerophosphoryl diester phosphodiesterase
VAREIRIYAHRGASAEAPENTMPAFRLALELGVDALELDIHRTRDGVLVVHHDPDGRRMCGVPRLIADTDWAEVRRWDCGAGFVAPDGTRPFAGRDVGIPRFEDVITELRDVRLNVDLKRDIADAAVALLRRLGAEERTCLASFQMSTMRRVRALGYRGATGLSRPEVAALLALPAALCRGPFRPRATAAQLPISLARAWVLARMKTLGLRVDYWTIDDPALARKLVALGADGIMTNDPRRIIAALRPS